MTKKKSRQSLQTLLHDFCEDVDVVGTADSVAAGLELIERKQPELVFLDVEMPNGNGFTLLQQLQKINFRVIFVTAYDQYAMKAIKYSALDYLLKPIDPDELLAAIERYRRHAIPEIKPHIVESLVQAPKIALGKNCIAYLQRAGICGINPDHPHGSRQQLHPYLPEGWQAIHGITHPGRVRGYAGRTSFFPVHKSHLVNLRHIHKITKGKLAYVVMDDQSTLEVAGRRKEHLLRVLQAL